MNPIYRIIDYDNPSVNICEVREIKLFSKTFRKSTN